MIESVTHLNPADLAGVAAVWLMGLIFLGMNVVAVCRYLRNGR